MTRFYTNPFHCDAEMAVRVGVSEPRYSGLSLFVIGRAYESWVRDVTFSDGTRQTEEVDRRHVDWKPDPQMPGWMVRDVGKYAREIAPLPPPSKEAQPDADKP